MAATMLEADAGDIELKDGNFTVAGTDKTIPSLKRRGIFVRMGPMTEFGIGPKAPAVIRRSRQAIRTARMVEVEIDLQTGEVAVDRYVTVDDFGQVSIDYRELPAAWRRSPGIGRRFTSMRSIYRCDGAAGHLQLLAD